ncbi:MAG: glycosyltransferase family 39 protein [Actinobacteria bacterium]|nr:glycosyltransferase family 39 protein [Actinomycetota bacterium]
MEAHGPEAEPAPPAAAATTPYRRAVATAALCGLAIRVLYAVGWRFDAGLLYDGPVYRNRAIGLLEGRSFLDPDAWFFHSQLSEGSVHPPGNLLFLALGHQLGFDTPKGLQIWGCLLGTATIVLVAELARGLAGRRVGILAAALAAVHPGFWSYDPTAMAETPGQFATAGTLLLGYRFWRTPTASRAAWLGGAAAAGALVRSELLLLVPILVIPLCLASRGTGRQVALRSAAALLWVGMVLAPWVGWNVVRYEHPVTMASGLDVSLSYAQCDQSWYGPDTGYWTVFCGQNIRDDVAGEQIDESELGLLYREQASDYIRDHLGRWPVVTAARVGRTLSIYQPARQVELEHTRESREESVLWMAMIASWTLAALGVVAFWRPPSPATRAALLPLLAPLAAGVAGAAITFGTTRYRSAGEVGLVVLGALGIEALLRLGRGGARGPGRAGAGPADR